MRETQPGNANAMCTRVCDRSRKHSRRWRLSGFLMRALVARMRYPCTHPRRRLSNGNRKPGQQDTFPAAVRMMNGTMRYMAHIDDDDDADDTDPTFELIGTPCDVVVVVFLPMLVAQTPMSFARTHSHTHSTQHSTQLFFMCATATDDALFHTRRSRFDDPLPATQNDNDTQHTARVVVWRCGNCAKIPSPGLVGVA